MDAGDAEVEEAPTCTWVALVILLVSPLVIPDTANHGLVSSVIEVVAVAGLR